MSVLFYRRPDYVVRAPGYLSNADCQRYVERTKGSRHKPPPELSFENIINNTALPPCALGDFMDYMIYITHDAEQLQFYLWFRDYADRFDKLPKPDSALSPPWNETLEKEAREDNDKSEKPYPSEKSSYNSFVHPLGGSEPPLDDPNWPLPPEGLDDDVDFKRFLDKSISTQLNRASAHSINSAINTPGLQWSGFSIQPLRAEVTRIIAHYFAPGAPRELPLSNRTRAQVLHALQHTTHPSAFRPAIDLIETSLKHQAHPNFIRWAICNGNKPRVYFVKVASFNGIFLGFVLALVLSLSSVSRWWRIFAALFWFIGISSVIAAYQGLCVILYSGNKRTLDPWKDPAALYSTFTGADDGATGTIISNPSTRTSRLVTHSVDSPDWISLESSSRASSRGAFTAFGGPNDFENVHTRAFNKRALLAKIFTVTNRIQNTSIRVMQDKIVLQANLWALLLTVILTAWWVALPKGNFY